MSNRHNLASDEVVEAVDAVRVNEAVADPASGLDDLVDLCDDIERFLDAIGANRVRVLLRRFHRLRLKLEDEERLVGGDAQQFAALAPEHLSKTAVTSRIKTSFFKTRNVMAERKRYMFRADLDSSNQLR